MNRIISCLLQAGKKQWWVTSICLLFVLFWLNFGISVAILPHGFTSTAFLQAFLATIFTLIIFTYPISLLRERSSGSHDFARSIDAQIEASKKVMSALNICVVFIDTKLNILASNSLANQLFKQADDPVVGENLSTLIPKETAVEIEKQVKATLLSPESKFDGINLRLESSQESASIWSLHLIPIIDQKLSRSVIAVSIQDASESQNAKSAAYNILEMQTKLITTISRAVRDPVTVLEHTLFLIHSQCKAFLDPGTLELLEIGKDNLEKLNLLIHKTLDSPNPRKEKATLTFSKGSINSVIEEAIQMVDHTRKDKQLKLVKNFDPNIPNFPFDMEKMRDVFIHIIDNAIKFTIKGTITIATRVEENLVVIAVSDTGIGIASSDLQKIFAPYIQIHKTGISPGTGLGLSYSKHIVNMHHGKIYAESEEGKGSTFIIKIPMGSK